MKLKRDPEIYRQYMTRTGMRLAYDLTNQQYCLLTDNFAYLTPRGYKRKYTVSLRVTAKSTFDHSPRFLGKIRWSTGAAPVSFDCLYSLQVHNLLHLLELDAELITIKPLPNLEDVSHRIYQTIYKKSSLVVSDSNSIEQVIL